MRAPYYRDDTKYPTPILRNGRQPRSLEKGAGRNPDRGSYSSSYGTETLRPSSVGRRSVSPQNDQVRNRSSDNRPYNGYHQDTRRQRYNTEPQDQWNRTRSVSFQDGSMPGGHQSRTNSFQNPYSGDLYNQRRGRNQSNQGNTPMHNSQNYGQTVYSTPTQNRQQTYFTGTCFRCGGRGHFARQCWQDNPNGQARDW